MIKVKKKHNHNSNYGLTTIQFLRKLDTMLSNFKNREIFNFIFSPDWLGNEMLFIAGPRQCGKTSLAKYVLDKKGTPSFYYNWDIIKVRKRYYAYSDFLSRDISKHPGSIPWVVFDEIHKLSNWKNILKSTYDELQNQFHLIVTGSAKLDMFRKSGDSLIGRYVMVHLFPFSLNEWAGNISKQGWLNESSDWKHMNESFTNKLTDTRIIPTDISESYFKFGPFPTPLISGSEKRSRKWHKDYISLLVREDLRDLSKISELDRVEHLVSLLPDRIGSTISYRSLGQDLDANHATIKNWLKALQQLYLVWPLHPFAGKRHRSLKKDSKWYFLDWTYASHESNQFENMIATSLLRFVNNINDQGYPELALHFYRTYDKKEIDFVLCHDNKPIAAFEVKLKANKIPSQMHTFYNDYKQSIPLVTVINDPGVLIKKENGFIVGYDRLLSIL
jgi:hypothetical protein